MNLRLLICASLISGSLAAQDATEKFYTAGLVNGRTWDSMDVGSRTAYLIGFSEALSLGACDDRTEYMSSSDKYTYDELRAMVGDFYNDRANVLIPISSAVRFSMLRATGIARSKLDRLIADARREASKR